MNGDRRARVRPRVDAHTVGPGSDGGSGTIWMLGVGLAVLAFSLAGATAGGALVDRHRAETAADLGALAGAARAVDGQQAACGEAERIIVANGGRLAACRVEALDVIVTVTVDGHRGWGTAKASARAGPARSP